MAAFLNKNSFYCIHRPTPFSIKTNLRENRFFAARWAVGGQKGTHNVKFIAKTRQNKYSVNTHEWPTAPRTCTLATSSASGCRACYLHTASCKRRSNLPFTAGFSTCRECMEQLPPGCLLKYNHVLPQTNGAVFQVFIVSLSRNSVHERGVIWLLTFPKNTEHQRKKSSSTSCRHWKKTNTYAHLANGGTWHAM